LTQWDTKGLFALQLGGLIRQKSDKFGLPLPVRKNEVEDTTDARDTNKVKAKKIVPSDSKQNDQSDLTKNVIANVDMIFKLITERQKYLQELHRYKSETSPTKVEDLNSRVDLQLRYSTALKRDLRKALQDFRELQRNPVS
jgi:hypothetical protein